ncbi:hypothetical protein AC579_7137 [Pseudocercospora musae]|uniref:Uncharacterized protein n=1 Tax=Pseudocercospora musae TaxID=113226 RepID=A0A139IMP7_9PEZI|nr:hypothetical protein AC579_7137 [Pseudocercospora musae]
MFSLHLHLHRHRHLHLLVHFIVSHPSVRALLHLPALFMGRKAVKTVLDPTKSLSEQLSRLFPPQRRTPSSWKGRSYRSDVVGEELCNDVIKYIAPTLEPYKGCTVVDINPGSCLWSDKLHRFLNPKCHLLMEPDEEYVEPFIKPLLQKPGSTYVHTSLSGINSRDYIQNWNELFADGSLIGRNRLHQDDPNLRRVDTSLLITGSLVRRNDLTFVQKKYINPQLSLLNAAWSSLQNGVFHQAGLVRMLWWLAEPDKIALLPHVSNYKLFASAALGLSCNTNEVVAMKSSREYKDESEKVDIRSRYSGISAESSARVQERMADRGIIVPEGREVHQREPVKEDTQTQWNSPLAVKYHTLPEFEAEFEELSERVNKHIEIKTGKKISPSHRPALQRLVDSMRYPQVHGAISEHRSRVSMYAKKYRVARSKTTGVASRFGPKTEERVGPAELSMALCADSFLHMINLEVHYKFLEENGVDVSAFKPKLASLLQQIDEWSRCGSGATQLADTCRLWEDVIDFEAPTPILITDRRQYEALRAKPEDFYPAANVCMLDITPNELDMAVSGVADRNEVANLCRYLLKIMFSLKSRSVTSALDRIAPSAAKDLIPMVPAITDPRRGGRLDPANLKVRQLTDEMLEGLAKAWVEWPFKPEMHEMPLELFDED